MTNLLQTGDTYKDSHVGLLRDDATHTHAYLSSRGGVYEELPFHGLQYILDHKFTRDSIVNHYGFGRWVQEIAAMGELHGISYPDEEMTRMLEKHDGNLPLSINALPEGTLAKPHDVLLNITNTDPEFPWLVGMMGEHLTKLWYPITVAAKARSVKKILEPYYKKTSDNPTAINFAYHNMGDRACTCDEQAAIGGLAHLTSFMGTDNRGSLWHGRYHYDEPCAGFNIPATEHSIMTSEGREGEYRIVDRFINKYIGLAHKNPMIACVLDSYNIYDAVEYVTTGARKEIIEADGNPIFVIRPDSGNPLTVIPKILEIMKKNCCDFTYNSKALKVFSKYRIIWSDGLTPSLIRRISSLVTGMKYSIENIVFGAGGNIMQKLDRDTCKFAFKQSAICIGGVWHDQFKDPIDDAGKKSLAGRVTDPRLIPVFKDGEILNRTTFQQIRDRLNG